jgi:hypothetical protein
MGMSDKNTAVYLYVKEVSFTKLVLNNSMQQSASWKTKSLGLPRNSPPNFIQPEGS